MIMQIFWYYVIHFLDEWIPEFPRLEDLPIDVAYYFDFAAEWIGKGFGIVSNFVSFEVIMPIAAFSLTVEAVILLYGLVMWILEKIPVINVDR